MTHRRTCATQTHTQDLQLHHRHQPHQTTVRRVYDVNGKMHLAIAHQFACRHLLFLILSLSLFPL